MKKFLRRINTSKISIKDDMMNMLLFFPFHIPMQAKAKKTGAPRTDIHMQAVYISKHYSVLCHVLKTKQ